MSAPSASSVLNEVEKYERMQKMNSGIMQKLNDDPEAKQAYEILFEARSRSRPRTATASMQNTSFNLAHRAPTVPKRKVPEAECALEDKIHAGQRLTALLRRGAPVRVPASNSAPRPVKAARLCLSALNNQCFRCRRLNERDRINDIYSGNYQSLELTIYGIETTSGKTDDEQLNLFSFNQNNYDSNQH